MKRWLLTRLTIALAAALAATVSISVEVPDA